MRFLEEALVNYWTRNHSPWAALQQSNLDPQKSAQRASVLLTKYILQSATRIHTFQHSR